MTNLNCPDHKMKQNLLAIKTLCQDYNSAFHATDVVCVVLGIYNLMLTPKNILLEALNCKFIYSQSFYQETAVGKSIFKFRFIEDS